jgi:hypothetical protein
MRSLSLFRWVRSGPRSRRQRLRACDGPSAKWIVRFDVRIRSSGAAGVIEGPRELSGVEVIPMLPDDTQRQAEELDGNKESPMVSVPTLDGARGPAPMTPASAVPRALIKRCVRVRSGRQVIVLHSALAPAVAGTTGRSTPCRHPESGNPTGQTSPRSTRRVGGAQPAGRARHR